MAEENLSSGELEQFKLELTPIFDEKHFTWGHGTLRKEAAEAIFKKGLFLKTPDLSTTAIDLENSERGIHMILHWPHHRAPFVVVIMIPNRDIGKSSGVFAHEHIFEPVEDPEERKYGKYKLSPRFIKGYIDTELRKLIGNPGYQEDPFVAPPIKGVVGIGSRPKQQSQPIDIPESSSKAEAEIENIW